MTPKGYLSEVQEQALQNFGEFWKAYQKADITHTIVPTERHLARVVYMQAYESGSLDMALECSKQVFSETKDTMELLHKISTGYLEGFTDTDLKNELARRGAERKNAKALQNRCGNCRHYGSVNQNDEARPREASWWGKYCPFVLAKKGRKYKLIPQSQKACKEHFERK